MDVTVGRPDGEDDGESLVDDGESLVDDGETLGPTDGRKVVWTVVLGEPLGGVTLSSLGATLISGSLGATL